MDNDKLRQVRSLLQEILPLVGTTSTEPVKPGYYIVEGEFSTEANTYRLSFDHTEGKAPDGIYVEYTGEPQDLCQRKFIYLPEQDGFGATYEWSATNNNYTLHPIKKVDTMSGNSAEFVITDTNCVVRSRAGSRVWLAGPYKYKLFFKN